MKKGEIDIPDQDGGILIIPAWEDIPQAIETNRKIFSEWKFSIGGITAQTFREMARDEASRLSNSYTANFTPNSKPIDRDSIIIETGHQPGLSHPGVMAKYFFIDNLAAKNDYVGLNLIVDSDTFDEIGINIPDIEKTHISLLAAKSPIPLETANPIKGETFNLFLADIDKAIDKPYLRSIRNDFAEWERELKNNPPKSLAPAILLTHLRRLFTRGEELKEIPLSTQSEGTTFLTFFLHIVQKAELFSKIYNEQLSLYRKTNKIRDKAHPFTDLKIDDYTELPFWYIRDNERRRIAVKLDSKKILVSANGDNLASIPIGNINGAIEIIREKGLKIRPNGLTTTMFNRMFIADLFIHGAGGAKYDIVTDAVIREFFGAKPPLYATVTMTKYPDITVEDKSALIKELESKLRDIEYNPDRYVESKNPLANEKKGLLVEITKQGSDKKTIGGRISAINQELLSTLKEEIKDGRMELKKLREEMEIYAHIKRRDYPYFFFKAASLNSIVNTQSIRTK